MKMLARAGVALFAVFACSAARQRYRRWPVIRSRRYAEYCASVQESLPLATANAAVAVS